MHGPDPGYYRRVADWSSRPGYRRELSELRRRLAPVSGARILDVGCGTGSAMRLLRRTGCEIIGVERSPAGVGACDQRPVTLADAAALPFPDGTFDVAVLMHVMGHLSRPLEGLREIRRVLRPGGSVGILTPNARFVRLLRLAPGGRYVPDPTVERHYTLRELRALLARSGFRVEHGLPWGRTPLGVPAPPLRERLLMVARAGATA